MNYHRKIELKDFGIIQRKSLEFLKVYYPNIYSGATIPWNVIPLDQYLKHCPEFEIAFQEFNLTPIFLSAFVMNRNEDCSVHIDYYASETFSNVARINLPILNCNGTYTNYWTGGEPWVLIKRGPPKGSYYKYTSSEFTLVDRVCIDSPTVIRVDKPHSVTLNQNAIPRITFTIGFDRDPVFLLDNNSPL